jgi:ATP-dependent DNA helicase RecG
LPQSVTYNTGRSSTGIKLEDSVQYLKGVGPQRAKALNEEGIRTVEDLLYHIPRRYLDRSKITPINQLSVNSRATVLGTVEAYGIKRGRKTRFQVIIRDQNSFLTLIWFEGIRYVKNRFKEGDTVVASGDVRFYDGLQIPHPEFEIISKKGEELVHTGRVIPIYPSTAKLKKLHLDSRGMRNILKPFLDKCYIKETLPRGMISSLSLLPLGQALKNIHFPQSFEMAEKARQRLAFDELFYLELMLALRKKRHTQIEKGIRFKPPGKLIRGLLKQLHFELTPAQKKVLREIVNDMTPSKQMNRLLQGDVGSGKTIVALVAILLAVENDYQAAVMAPTEILAEQHYLNIHSLLESLKVKPVLLTGSITGNERKGILKKIENGESRVIIGTHALIQEGLSFHGLGLAVIDEQHRFGVMQRARLKQKGFSPDVLVMTATPIPRTLALTVYGDLDVSVIDQMPPGRKKIQTTLLDENSSEELYNFLEEEFKKGHQAYIVYPLVEESEKLDLKAATESFEHIQKEVFPHRRVALLHGRIKSDLREKLMQDFRNKKFDILVCTTVIEVGLDIPNATVMVIEHAERFGLSQLHQLRGRIGRGSDQSFCFLKAAPPISDEAKKRLEALCRSNDGFKIAEWDLRLRGPGEFFGTRQHGLPELKIADIINDVKLLYQAREWAFRVIGDDPHLKKKENSGLRSNFLRKYKERQKLMDVG